MRMRPLSSDMRKSAESMELLPAPVRPTIPIRSLHHQSSVTAVEEETMIHTHTPTHTHTYTHIHTHTHTHTHEPVVDDEGEVAERPVQLDAVAQKHVHELDLARRRPLCQFLWLRWLLASMCESSRKHRKVTQRRKTNRIAFDRESRGLWRGRKQ
jgi:hypothetical protein